MVRPGTSLLLILSLMVAACTDLQKLRDNMSHPATESTAAPVVDGKHGVHSWLADIKDLQGRPPESLPAILDAREQAFRARPDTGNRMRLVMLLLVNDESVRDDRRARLLLRKLDPLPSSPDDRAFIALLQDFLDGNREYEQKLSVLWKQVTQQNKRIVELEAQLKALTNIEQKIQQREPLPVQENDKQ